MDNTNNNNLHLAYWINTHYDLLRTIGQFILGGIAGLIWIIAFLQLFQYIGNLRATRAALDINNTANLQIDSITAPEPPVVISESTYDAGESTTAVILVQNVNQKHAVRISLAVAAAGSTRTLTNKLIAEGEQRYFVVPNVGEDIEPTTEITSVEYLRSSINRPQVNFEVNDALFQPVQLVQQSAQTDEDPDDTEVTAVDIEEIRASSAANAPYTAYTATAQNNSALGFQTAEVVVLLQNGGGVTVGANSLTLKQFTSFSTQPITMLWRRRFTIDITPTVFVYADFLDEENVIVPSDN